MNRMVLKILTYIFSFYIISLLFPSIRVDSITALILAGTLLTFVNILIRPLLIIITLPVNLITLGLFTLIVNTWMVMLTDWLVEGLNIPGFGLSFLAALIISIFSMVFQRMEKES